MNRTGMDKTGTFGCLFFKPVTLCVRIVVQKNNETSHKEHIYLALYVTLNHFSKGEIIYDFITYKWLIITIQLFQHGWKFGGKKCYVCDIAFNHPWYSFSKNEKLTY